MNSVVYYTQRDLCKDRLSDREAYVLAVISEHSPSLYKLEKLVDVPLATLWRAVKKLETLGYVIHSKRGTYEVTVKGLLYLLVDKKVDFERAMNSIARRINTSVEAARNIVKCLFNISDSVGLCVLDVIDNPRLLTELALAKALQGKPLDRDFLGFIWGSIEALYPVKKVDNCEVIIVSDIKGPRILVGRCEREGFASNAACPHVLSRAL